MDASPECVYYQSLDKVYDRGSSGRTVPLEGGYAHPAVARHCFRDTRSVREDGFSSKRAKRGFAVCCQRCSCKRKWNLEEASSLVSQCLPTTACRTGSVAGVTRVYCTFRTKTLALHRMGALNCDRPSHLLPLCWANSNSPALACEILLITRCPKRLL